MSEIRMYLTNGALSQLLGSTFFSLHKRTGSPTMKQAASYSQNGCSSGAGSHWPNRDHVPRPGQSLHPSLQNLGQVPFGCERLRPASPKQVCQHSEGWFLGGKSKYCHQKRGLWALGGRKQLPPRPHRVILRFGENRGVKPWALSKRPYSNLM